ncbi:hypothetical protein KAZ57_01825 [Patescibacteria group bacterium]|nr:hypothetical protein [Patescibacteria group bacterium]
MEWTFWNIVLASILIFAGFYLIKKLIDHGPAIVLFIVGVVMMFVGGFVYVISAFALRRLKEDEPTAEAVVNQKAVKVWRNLYVDMTITYSVVFSAFSPATQQLLTSSGISSDSLVVVRRCGYAVKNVHVSSAGIVYVIPDQWLKIYQEHGDSGYMRAVMINTKTHELQENEGA